MPRIRTIKPEFPQSESVGKLSRDARLLFIQLWTLADDSGRLRGNSRMLASLLYPYDDDAITLLPIWLAELIDAGTIRRYVVADETFLDIPKWLNHQKIDHATASKLPAYSEEFARPREDSEKFSLDQGMEGIKEGIKEGRVSAPGKPDAKTLIALGVDEQAAKDWLAVRKAKKAPLTETVLDDLRREAGKAGITVAEAVSICARRSWQGFNASWNWRDNNAVGNKQTALEERNRRVAEEAAKEFANGSP